MATLATRRWQRAGQQVIRQQAIRSAFAASDRGRTLLDVASDLFDEVVDQAVRSDRARQRWQLLRPAPIRRRRLNFSVSGAPGRWDYGVFEMTVLKLLNVPISFLTAPTLMSQNRHLYYRHDGTHRWNREPGSGEEGVQPIADGLY